MVLAELLGCLVDGSFHCHINLDCFSTAFEVWQSGRLGRGPLTVVQRTAIDEDMIVGRREDEVLRTFKSHNLVGS